MAWLDKLKLNKQLVRNITEEGLVQPKDIQLKTLTRIAGGQDIIAIGPDGCGKTTTYILAALNRIRHTPEGVPDVLVLVPGKDQVIDVVSQFDRLKNNKQVAVVGLYPAPGMETQMNALADGADIVVATPDRARAIYLKLGLNLNKIGLFIVDDADLMVKQGLQLPVNELANSITKCQHLVFTSVIHDKLNKMIAPFMNGAAVVEVEEDGEIRLETHPQLLYHVPNFGTKLNLLRLFMQDEELFTKTAVFVNTRKTAEKVYKTLQNREKNTTAILNSPSVEFLGFKTIFEFIESNEARVLIINDEKIKTAALNDIPFLIHFELPEHKETFIERILNNKTGIKNEKLAITLATDLELTMVRKIEQAIGEKIPLAELPDNLVIEKERKNTDTEEKTALKSEITAPVAGEAFHQKKPENAKTYNYSAGVKAKMNKKKKHG
jgi:ATP-dependent RNA helicase RhlE